jgi:Holliday junction resolvase-like predicted endonuclease
VSTDCSVCVDGTHGCSKIAQGATDPREAVTAEKQRRVRRAATAWLAAHPELARLQPGFDVVAVREGRLERLGDAF